MLKFEDNILYMFTNKDSANYLTFYPEINVTIYNKWVKFKLIITTQNFKMYIKVD